MFGTMLGNVDVITLGLDVGIDLESLDGYFGVSNDGKLEVLFIGGSLGSTYCEILGSDEGIKLVSTGGKVFSTILGNVDVSTFGLDVGIDLGSLD